MQLTTHLSFNGQCEAAFKFYEKALGAKIAFSLTWAGSPMANEAPPGWGEKILHATLVLGDVHLSGDDMPSGPENKPQGFALTLSMKDPAEAERVYAVLSEKGNATMPLVETFWAHRFGVLTDQFGIPWMINCEKPM
jgi:PhnB protein